MGRVFIDGFESGSLDLWDTIGGSAGINNSLTGRDGNYCLNCYGAGSAPKYLMNAIPSKSELYVAFLFYPSVSGRIFSFYNSGTKLGYISLSSTSGGNIQAYKGPSTLLATGTAMINGSTWYLIEIHYIPATSGGVFQVKVNGISDISYSGSTTPAATTINQIMLSEDGNNWGSGYYDNIIVDDANWIGNTRIQAIQVNGPGGFTQFTPSAGANWQNVEEIPYSETDYNETGVSAKVDTFTHAALSGSPAAVKCVQVQARAKLIGNPTPTNLQLVVNSGGTAYFSGSKALALASKGVSALWATDPATGQPWTVADVNAAEIGYKSV